MTVQALLWAHSIERLMVCAFGGVSLVLGWSLFRAAITREPRMDPAKNSVSTLSRIGPACFFTLFGFGVLGLILVQSSCSSGQVAGWAMPAGSDPHCSCRAAVGGGQPVSTITSPLPGGEKPGAKTRPAGH